VNWACISVFLKKSQEMEALCSKQVCVHKESQKKESFDKMAEKIINTRMAQGTKASLFCL
jgi:hypothetical protein